MDYYLLENFFINIKNIYLMVIATIAITNFLEKGGKINEYGY